MAIKFNTYTVNSSGTLVPGPDGNWLTPVVGVVKAPLDALSKESDSVYVTQRDAAIRTLLGVAFGAVAVIGHNTYQRSVGKRAITFN